MDLLPKTKKHRPSKSGAKAKKKDENNKKKRGLSTERHNPRAFSVANIGRTKRTQQRNLDRQQKKEVVPLVNRTEELPPPIVIVVVGPRGVGKSSLIRSLVKLYTGQNIVDIKGPVTVVAGKKIRFTFFECPLDIYSMTDLAKIADLVFLMIDASYGFEMDTFEFLNLLQLHGFPKVIGILTHLDQFKVNKSLQKTKKKLKHRFWTEIYKGAKIFEFTGVVNGKYLKHEVKRMSLYITRLKFRPLIWRNTHPYLLVDRVDDITPTSTIQENPTCDREISFHGYVRGTHLKSSLRLHLIGAGDFDIASVTALEDPCPMPSQNDRTTLKNSKDNFLYAPMSNVGRVKIDKDGMYIEIKDIHYTKPEMLDLVDQNAPESYRSLYDDITRGTGVHTPAGILRSMQDVDIGVDERLNNAELSLFQGESAIKSSQTHFSRDADGYSDESDEEGDESGDGESDGEEDDDDNHDEDSDMEDNEDVSDEGDDDISVDESDIEDNDDDEENSDAEEGDEDGNWSDDGDSDFENDIPVQHEKVENSNAKWKENLGQRAEKSFTNRSTVHGISIMERVYGKGWVHNGGLKDDFMESQNTADDSDSDSDDEFFQPKRNALKSQYDFANRLDSNKPSYTRTNLLLDKDLERSKLWEAFATGKSALKSSKSDDNAVEIITKYTNLKNRFVTGNWGKTENDLSNGLSDDEGFGEFEDLQTGEVFGSNGVRNSDDESDDEGVVDMEKFNQDIDEQLREANAARKAASRLTNGEDENSETEKAEKKNEDDTGVYGEKLQQELLARKERNKGEFGAEGEQVRMQYEGVRQGVYVKVVLRHVPFEFTKGFRPSLPLILGGLLAHESNMGIITARVKRHRWHRKLLKSDDVLTFSIGWRRYQSIPIFSMEDENMNRRRHLKYTPEHMHCTCSFYGPLVPPNTGVLAYLKPSRHTAGFRISLTGLTIEVLTTSNIVKKLKLVGTPTEIHKNTAYIKGMFNSQLEVAKFEGAKLKTVSGIRGQIKKSASNKGEAGLFRATFEDKILMSDIVTCRLWVPIPIKEFYNPVLTLLDAIGDDGSEPGAWKGMRTIAEIRRDSQIAIPLNKDSLYKPVTRIRREFGKILVPQKLQEALPFASKPKEQRKKNKDSYVAKRAVVLEPEDKKRRAVVQILETIRTDKVAKRLQSQKIRTQNKTKEMEKAASKFADVHKSEKRKRYAAAGKEEARREKKQKASTDRE